jgi:hypothetical protein
VKTRIVSAMECSTMTLAHANAILVTARSKKENNLIIIVANVYVHSMWIANLTNLLMTTVATVNVWTDQKLVLTVTTLMISPVNVLKESPKLQLLRLQLQHKHLPPKHHLQHKHLPLKHHPPPKHQQALQQQLQKHLCLLQQLNLQDQEQED